MSGASQTEALLHRFFDEVLNARDRSAAAELAAPSFTDHDAAPGQANGIEDLVTTLDALHEGLPDYRYEPLLVIAEDYRVAAHWRMTATNDGSLFGQAPTGRSVAVTGVDVLGIRRGRLEERWSKWESHLLLEQLGMTPPARQGG